MHLHIFFFVNSNYLYTLAVRNDIIMLLQSVKNPANPVRSTERNGISTLIMLFRSLRVGFLILFKKCETTRTKKNYLLTLQ